MGENVGYAINNASDVTVTVAFPPVEFNAPVDLTPVPTIGNGDGCRGRWASPNHALFQMAHTALLIAFLAPSTMRGTVFFHGTLVLAFLLLSTWAWAMLCAPDVFSWNFSFMVINSIQVLFIMYQLRPIKFSPELEDIYTALFQPLRVPRSTFKKLVSPDYCTVLNLHYGEAYASQQVTKTDRLALLINGTAHVTCHGQFLHYVQERQFLDSPEFEASGSGDEKFRVTITAALPCRYMCWQRQSLEYLFGNDPYLATVMGYLLGRDITNKLYLLNDKLRAQHGRQIDIRLPSVSTAALSGVDLRSLSLRRESLCGENLEMTTKSEADEAEGDEDSMDDSDEKTHMFPNGVGHHKSSSPLSSNHGSCSK